MQVLVFVQPVDDTTGLLMGTVIVPACFRPTDEFVEAARDLGICVAIQDDEEFQAMWGLAADDHVYRAQGSLVLEAVRAADRYARSTLN